MEYQKVNINTKNISFKEIFDIYYPKLCYFAKQIVGRKDVAKDIVQETFLRIYEADSTYESEISFRSFIYKAVKNRCLDYLKHEKVSLAYISKLDHVQQEDYILSRLIDSETISIINKAINELPPSCSTIMKLSLCGKKNQEIADMLNISIFTVKAQKQRALTLLKNMIDPEIFLIIISNLTLMK